MSDYSTNAKINLEVKLSIITSKIQNFINSQHH